MDKFREFDDSFATEFVALRRDFAKAFLEELRPSLQITSAADIGCGVGYFSRFLRELGLRVTGIDGRKENVEECRRRYPDIAFETANAEDLDPERMGQFDLVLCFGLLYHLENPFRAARGLYAITGRIVLIESMCAPGTKPAMELLDEADLVNQGLNYVAFYPTEACLVKMLYRAGFRFVYGFSRLPDHAAFHNTNTRKRERTVLAASNQPLSASGLRLIREPVRSWDIWPTRLGAWQAWLEQLPMTLRVIAGRALRGRRSASK